MRNSEIALLPVAGTSPRAPYGALSIVSKNGVEYEDRGTTLTLRCFICIALAVFLGDAGRGLVTPSIVPYINKVQPPLGPPHQTNSPER